MDKKYCVPIKVIPNCLSYIYNEQKGLLCDLCEKNYVRSYDGSTCAQNQDSKAPSKCLGSYFNTSVAAVTSCELCDPGYTLLVSSRICSSAYTLPTNCQSGNKQGNKEKCFVCNPPYVLQKGA